MKLTVVKSARYDLRHMQEDWDSQIAEAIASAKDATKVGDRKTANECHHHANRLCEDAVRQCFELLEGQTLSIDGQYAVVRYAVRLSSWRAKFFLPRIQVDFDTYFGDNLPPRMTGKVHALRCRLDTVVAQRQKSSCAKKTSQKKTRSKRIITDDQVTTLSLRK